MSSVSSVCGCAVFSLNFAICSLLTLQPHTRRLQVVTSSWTSRQIIPVEDTAAAGSVHSAVGAPVVPESTAVIQCAVSWWPPVIGAEAHTVAVAECIFASVTRVPRHLQSVVVCLTQYSERTVLGMIPVAGVATWLQVELQLIAVVHCQLTEQVVAEPVVAAWVVETDFKLRPGTIEEVGPVDVLLDQQRDAVGYRT